MARNGKITIHDREAVITNLALGKSTREAIKGTNIKSNRSAFEIAHDAVNDIKQRRQFFLQTIYENGASDSQRAVRWAKMTQDKNAIVAQSALKYIDTLSGLAQPIEEDGAAIPVVQIEVINTNVQANGLQAPAPPRTGPDISV